MVLPRADIVSRLTTGGTVTPCPVVVSSFLLSVDIDVDVGVGIGRSSKTN